MKSVGWLFQQLVSLLSEIYIKKQVSNDFLGTRQFPKSVGQRSAKFDSSQKKIWVCRVSSPWPENRLFRCPEKNRQLMLAKPGGKSTPSKWFVLLKLARFQTAYLLHDFARLAGTNWNRHVIISKFDSNNQAGSVWYPGNVNMLLKNDQQIATFHQKENGIFPAFSNPVIPKFCVEQLQSYMHTFLSKEV